MLSIVTETSARPSGARPLVPAKITSSILPPRSDFAPCSPITQLRASTTFDFPEPLGPTTQVMPGSRRSVVDEAKDLKPFSVMLFKYTGQTYPSDMLFNSWWAGSKSHTRDGQPAVRLPACFSHLLRRLPHPQPWQLRQNSYRDLARSQ
ncbi:unannotated protein [freshwater metagenome]|uniref:Unannotated protein n=1 Tax=freshwater metagenome TaxID=449393 RepID=A0A6J7A7E0_9ZZZZ